MSRYRSSGPSPVLIVLIGALIVFGGYVWTGMPRFFESRRHHRAGHAALPVDRSAPSGGLRAADGSGFCDAHAVAAVPVVRGAGSVCATGRAPARTTTSARRGEPGAGHAGAFTSAADNAEWYVVELNPEGAFRDIVYMHQSVIAAIDPTPTPTRTYTPLPTITHAV